MGIPLTLWRYLWRTVPLHRHEEPGEWPADCPPELPGDVSHHELQLVRNGAGPLFRRRYEVRIGGSGFNGAQLIAELARDPDTAAPGQFATFKKVKGESGEMGVGDEYVVRMPGPWDGPVRVVARSPNSFRLATLDGHLEAGQIEFTASDGDAIDFKIESWARAGDSLSNFLYHRLRISKEIQLLMWTSYLENVVGLSGGHRIGGLRIHTRRVEALPADA